MDVIVTEVNLTKDHLSLLHKGRSFVPGPPKKKSADGGPDLFPEQPGKGRKSRIYSRPPPRTKGPSTSGTTKKNEKKKEKPLEDYQVYMRKMKNIYIN